MKKVLTVGEMLLRLSPEGYKMITQPSANTLEMFYGGAELNVSVDLSNFGVNVGYFTKVPDNSLGRKGIKYLEYYGVDTTDIKTGGERLGIYFLEKGYSVRSSSVIYDRSHSSFSEIEMTDNEITGIIEKYDIIFLSGITAAISEKTFELSKKLVKIAKELKKEVVFDCNYRSKLITLEEAGIRYSEIIPYVDILFAGYLDFINIFGISHRMYDTDDYEEYYKEIYKKVYEKYSFKYIISSIRKPISANRNMYSGIITDGQNVYKGKEIEVEIIDRVGTGDAFTSGALYSYIKGKEINDIVNFAVCSGALKHTIDGDVSEITENKVLEIMGRNSFDVAR